jgi:cytochrome d ubiquinol oxidase subunit I
VALWAAWVAIRRHELATERPLLWAMALATPMGFASVEAGWVVTEVGRQPWIVTGVLRTADAVTPMPGLGYTLTGFTALYFMLALVVARLLYGLIVQTPAESEWHREYTPPVRADA